MFGLGLVLIGFDLGVKKKKFERRRRRRRWREIERSEIRDREIERRENGVKFFLFYFYCLFFNLIN